MQLPTSFRYRRSSEQENRRGRGRTFRRDPADSELSLAIQESIESASVPSSSIRPIADHGEFADFESIIPATESLAVTDTPSRYLQAVSQSSRSGTLGESSFPPLPVAPAINQQNSHPDVPSKKTMAAHLRSKVNKKVHPAASSSSPAWPAVTRAPSPAQPTINPHAWPAVNSVSGPVSSSGQSRPAVETGATPSASSLISSKASGSTSRMTHSSSAPNLSERELLSTTVTDFPPVSAASAQTRKPQPPAVDQALKVENVHTANKSLVEKMRSALGFDEDKFTAFKDISGEYRQGLMDAETYLSCVDQFGLSHLVPEMARLLPNAPKQKELMDAYNLNMAYSTSRDTISSDSVKHGNGSKKGKGKAVESPSSSVKNSFADSVINTINQLQSSYSQSTGEEVEVLSKDGYRGSKAKSKVLIDDTASGAAESTKSRSQVDPLPAGSGATNQNAGIGDGKSKKWKKTSKFHRVRLGDDSVEAFLDLKSAEPEPDPVPNGKEGSSGRPNDSLPVRGVWKNGGGQKLLGMTSRGSKN
ncbi:RING/U-box superfamily protein [Striga hermonthica]|uniref:RING/U-box superfamily protein n=1 Tax=Striga hermonthica TaxID=68872 RepID=A0A9N7N9E1_STRHE|nr:RING/U-box superfamily protein [Striga hermonthica]